MRLFLLLLLLFSFQFSFSHGDDEIPFVDFSRIMKELASDIEKYQNSPNDLLGGSENIYTVISKDGKSYKIAQSSITKVFAYRLALNKEVFDYYCSGGCEVQKRQSQIFLSRLYKKIISGEKKVINMSNLDKVLESLVIEGAVMSYKVVSFPVKLAYDFVFEDIPDFLWKSVGKTRSLGGIFVLINGIGEGLDMALIHPTGFPIPLCKIINATSFWIADKVKTYVNLTLQKQDGKHSLIKKWGTLKNTVEFIKTRNTIVKQANSMLFKPKHNVQNETNWLKRSWKKLLNTIDKYRLNHWEKMRRATLADFIKFSIDEINLSEDFKVLVDFNKELLELEKKKASLGLSEKDMEAIFRDFNKKVYVNLPLDNTFDKRLRELQDIATHIKEVESIRLSLNQVFLDQFNTLQAWINLLVDYYQELYEEKQISFKEHLKIQWRLGGIEKKFHSYKVKLLNTFNNPSKKVMFNEEIEVFLNDYKNILNELVEGTEIECHKNFL